MTAPTRQRVPPTVPQGINPSRARQTVRDPYARPALVPVDLSTPLLVLPGSPAPGPDRLPGACSLALRPVMTSVDVLTRLRDSQKVPVVAYSASGERPAPRALGTEGTTEYTATLKRAGADSILTFAAEQVATYLEDTRG